MKLTVLRVDVTLTPAIPAIKKLSFLRGSLNFYARLSVIKNRQLLNLKILLLAYYFHYVQ